MDINLISTILAALGSLTAIAIAIATALAVVINSRRGRQSHIGRVALLTTLAIAVILVGTVYLANGVAKNRGAAPVVAIPAIGATTAPSPTPTASSRTTQINQEMACTNCTSADGWTLTAKTATIDPGRGQTTLLLSLAHSSATTANQAFTLLNLQDAVTGNTVNGAGNGFSSALIAPVQTILYSPTFPFVPIPGREYSFSAQLSGPVFTPIIVKF
jgi:hypothetical protein